MSTKTIDMHAAEAPEVDQKVHSNSATPKMISIWFFVGCLLAIYGVLILLAGLRSDVSSARTVAMPGLHIQLWWGLGLLALGLVYIARFRPRR